MAALSLRHDGAHAPVPLGSYTGTLITELHDANGHGINHKQINATVTTPHTLGSLAAGLATLLNAPGAVLDLSITPK